MSRNEPRDVFQEVIETSHLQEILEINFFSKPNTTSDIIIPRNHITKHGDILQSKLIFARWINFNKSFIYLNIFNGCCPFSSFPFPEGKPSLKSLYASISNFSINPVSLAHSRISSNDLCKCSAQNNQKEITLTLSTNL